MPHSSSEDQLVEEPAIGLFVEWLDQVVMLVEVNWRKPLSGAMSTSDRQKLDALTKSQGESLRLPRAVLPELCR